MATAPLVTAEELASYLQHDLDRATAELAIGGASDTVRGYCGWDIAYEAGVTLTVDGNGARVLTLPTMLLLAVAEVRVDGTALDPGEYRWTPAGLLWRAAGWPLAFQIVEVDCDHGYQPVPDAAKVVTLALAARSYVNPERASARGVGAVSTSYDFREVSLSPLDQYRLP